MKKPHDVGKDSAAALYYAGFTSFINLRHLDIENPITLPTLDFLPNFQHAHFPIGNACVVKAFWSSSIIRGDDGKLYQYGLCPPGDRQICRIDFEEGFSADDVKSIFGDFDSLLGVVTQNGDLLLRSEPKTAESQVLRRPQALYDFLRQISGATFHVDAVATSGSDEVCMATTKINKETNKIQYAIHMFRNSATLSDSSRPQSSHLLPSTVISMSAGATAFVALLKDGSIWTCGSALQPAMLGRTPTQEAPAATPYAVNALGGVAIRKIVMCEWLGVALSHEKDLYIWGGRAGEGRRIASLPGSLEEVKLADIDGGEDIADVAVGMGHIAVLTMKGHVWVCGDNEHGQLGLGKNSGIFFEDWVQVQSNWPARKVVGVEAGGWGTWVLTWTDCQSAGSISQI